MAIKIVHLFYASQASGRIVMNPLRNLVYWITNKNVSDDEQHRIKKGCVQNQAASIHSWCFDKSSSFSKVLNFAIEKVIHQIHSGLLFVYYVLSN